MAAANPSRILSMESAGLPPQPQVEQPVADQGVAADHDLAAALVIPSASGAAVPVSEPLTPEQVRELLSEHTIQRVAAALGEPE
jgi:hypothetical protein